MSEFMIEKGTNYSYLLSALKNPSFEKIQRISINFANQLPEEVRTQLWSDLNHGVDVLESEALLSMYMSAYGKMHAAKLLAAYEHLSAENLSDIHIIDWGCGQAMATLLYFEYLKEKELASNVKSIILVEPSELALRRAALHAQKLFPKAEIQTVNKDFNSLTFKDIQIEDNQNLLHFFSNVLDIECFSIEQLAELIKKNTTHNSMVCVSPFINEYKNQRLYNFIECFPSANTLADYINSEWINGWTIDYKVVDVNLADKPILDRLILCPSEPLTDIDGNVYKTVKIGNQIWMAENLRVSKYRNGYLIPNIQDHNEWRNTKAGALCNYNNNTEFDKVYGKLYNWYAVDDERNLAPQGWHIPSDDEWQSFIDYIGDDKYIGKKLKEIGANYWIAEIESNSNVFGFSALPGGERSFGLFSGLGTQAEWWSASEYSSRKSWARGLGYLGLSNCVGRDDTFKEDGCSVRCVKDRVIIPFERNQKRGYCDINREIVIDAIYDFAEFFHGDVTPVQLNGSWSLINNRNEIVVHIKNYYYNGFYKPYYYFYSPCAGSNDAAWTLYDTKGNTIKTKKAYNGNGVEGFFLDKAVVERDNKFGFIDITGIEIIPCSFDSARNFHDGLSVVSFNRKYGYINELGEMVISCIFDEACDFSFSTACVKFNKKYGLIDMEGNYLLSPIYDDLYSVSNELILVRNKDKWHIIDFKGNMISKNYLSDCFFDNSMNGFSDNLLRFKKNNKWGYLDIFFEEKIPCQFKVAKDFRDGLAYVINDEKCGFINKNGDFVIEKPISKFSMSSQFEYDFVCVYDIECNIVCYIDKLGNEYWVNNL